MKLQLVLLAFVLLSLHSSVFSHREHSGLHSRRALVNITVDTDEITEEPLTASDLLIRTKLIAYAQKLAAKEAKKKLKAEKVVNKAAALAAGLPPALRPVIPTPAASNDTAPGVWLYSKSVFLSKLFTALANAAATLPGVTTTTTTELPTTESPNSDEDESTEAPLVNDISKRSHNAYRGSKRSNKHHYHQE